MNSRYFACLGVIAVSSLPIYPAALTMKEDGGASVYNENSGSSSTETLVDPAIAQAFPVGQRSEIHVLGGAVRGFGMLAQYDAASPTKVVIARKTTVSDKEPYTPIALASVFDPDGNVVAVEDLTDQPSGSAVRILEVPAGKPGIWRVSFSGGRRGDVVEIRLPQTEMWGVRGEMALGINPGLPRPAYLWVPPVSQQLLVGVDSGSPEGIKLENTSGSEVLAQPQADTAGRTGRLVLDPAPAGKLVRLVVPPEFKGSLTVEGAPGLWCPSEKAAQTLQGGAVEADGFWVAGPLQARARKWMVATAPSLDPSPVLTFPQAIPDSVTDLPLQVLAFQKYGPLNHLTGMIQDQDRNADPANPYFGSEFTPEPGKPLEGWTNFQPGKLAGPFQAASLAAAAAFESPLNPAYRHPEIVKRAALAAFHHFTWLQGDDLLRENSLFKGTYPMTHAFFVYGSLAQGYLSVRDLLPPEAAAIWKQGIMALGDKIADFQAYQSNQWAHVMEGHLSVYLATGEKRFLHFFERQMTAYLDNTFGPQSKFGQHPAGFFLEQCGPDGNYDKLNSFAVTSAYYEYRDLPEAKPELTEKLRAAIEKNLRFVSFFWLPQPDGEVTSPNAINCRTTAQLGSPGYPGQFLPKSEFSLAASRHALTRQPATGAGPAGTFSFLANNDAWIRQTLEDGLRKGGSGYPGGSGSWLPALEKAFSVPQKAQIVPIPVRETGKDWELPGLIAFNHGGIYGVVFYDVIGADHVLPGITGGGPSALWTPATGSFLQSMHAGAPPESLKITDPKSLTFACVFGRDEKGQFFYSGKERAELEKNDDQMRISSKLPHPFARLTWSYRPSKDGLDLGVTLKSMQAYSEGFANFPLSTRLPGTEIELVRPNELVFHTPDGGVRLTWPEGHPGQLTDSALPTIRRLLIPLPTDGSELQIQVRPIEKKLVQNNP